MKKQGLIYRTEREDGILLFRLNGEITIESEEVIKTMMPPGEEARTVLLDFIEVNYINSSGLALLIGLVRCCRDNGQTVGAVNLSDHYRKIFRMIGLNDYITIFENEGTARLLLTADNYKSVSDV